MKANFVNRTGRGGAINVAEEVEQRLTGCGFTLGEKKLPRSTMNRLLSSEAFRNRVGFSISKGRFVFTHQDGIVLKALQRIANDLAGKVVVLGDIWDVDGKRAYLDRLEQEGLLPTAADTIPKDKRAFDDKTQAPASTLTSALSARSSPAVAKPMQRDTLIPKIEYGIAWARRMHRHRAIWEELQHHLVLQDHPNAISVLLRVLIELSIDNYINQTRLAVGANDKLAMRVLKVGEDLLLKKKIDNKYFIEIKKLQQADKLLSADTLNRYVHSPDFAPSPKHLVALWDSFSNLVVLGLQA
jgi:hypothetical protein